jgi:hypothetical protein
MIKRELNRRTLLLGGAGAIGLSAGGAFLWNRYSQSRASWVEDVVRRNLPGVVLDEPSLQAFVRDVLSGDLLQPHLYRIAIFAQQATPWITARVPKVRDGLEKLERRVLTEYLLGSNFFRVEDSRRETIVYLGPAVACSNPFATLANSTRTT